MSNHHHGVVEFKNEPNIGLSWIVVLLTAVVLTVLVLGALIYYKSATSQALNDRELTAKPSDALLALRRYEAEMLGSLKWIDPTKGQLQIPITLAMNLVQKRYQRQ